ncbi:MAG: hypothetical protein KJ042_07860 [Deltaproteobacteria bacterium]|nr:hypothetical protein [Deltaproteobacteria bacterium]
MVTSPKAFDPALSMESAFTPEPVVSANLGLCANCRHQASCMNRSRASGPVLFCEDHETDIVLRAISDTPMFTHVDVTPPARTGMSSAARTGLCVNCDFRDTCTHPVAEGGVWRCEDYR